VQAAGMTQCAVCRRMSADAERNLRGEPEATDLKAVQTIATNLSDMRATSVFGT
jgi:hypothetical protein